MRRNREWKDCNFEIDIALQCYLTGGPAVFLARSMYCTAVKNSGYHFWDDCVFTPDTSGRSCHEESRKLMTADSTSNFKVYPNPMDKEHILNVESAETGEITFYDLLGRITYKSILSKGINTFDCDQLSCDNNVILYQAKLQSGKLETGRIVTLK